MAKLSILAGTTSKLIQVFIQDTSVTTGAGLTGLTNGSSGLTWYYYREGANASVAVSVVSMTLGTFTSSGFIVVDGTNMPGVYQLGVPNAALAAGAKSVVMMLKGVTNMAPVLVEIELTAVDNQDGVRFGLTALPNATVSGVGGLVTAPTTANTALADVTRLLGTAWLTPGVAGTPDVNAKLLGGTAQTGRDVGASVLLSAGTGTGQLDFTSGVVKANLAQILGTALTETAGLLAGGFKKFFNVATPTGTLNSIPDAVPDAAGGLPITGNRLTAIPAVALVTTVTNLTNAPTAGDLTATMKTSVTTAATAATPTAAAVTGAVGSVTARVTANTDQLAGQTVTAAAGVTFPASVASPTNITAGTITNLTNLPTIPANWITSAGITAGALNGKGDWNIGKTGYSLATDVWDEVLASHLTAGTTGFALNAAGAAGDPWSTAIPGTYGAGTAGNIVGNRIDAAISSRSTYAGGAVASVTGNVGGNVVGSVGSVTGSVMVSGGTITTLTNLPAIPANWLTAAGIEATALNGKGDWNIGKTGYSLTQAFPTNFGALNITVGGHISNVDTLTTYTGDTPQTGDTFARIGAAGAGLTALGDTRIAHLDADVSSRSTFAGGAVASVTGAVTVASGTITTLTNLPAITAGWITATGIAAAALNGKGDWNIGKTGYSLTLAPPTAIENADTLLDRNMATGVDSGSPTVRTVRQALRPLRNKMAIVAGTLTISKEDDTTPSWTAAITTDDTALPITVVDPA